MTKRLVRIWAVSGVFGLMAATQAFASFHSVRCSNAGGNITYSFDMAWNLPAANGKWTINGQILEDSLVTKEALKQPTELDSSHNEMTGVAIRAEQVRLRIQGREQAIEDWLICRSASGI